jgi:hypothetical protein
MRYLAAAVAAFTSTTAAAPRACPAPSVNTLAPAFITDPGFASWTIDPSRNRAFFDINFTDPRLLALAAEIGNGAVIRFGGGGADLLAYGVPAQCDSPPPAFGDECLNKSTLDALLGVAAAASARLVFGLNILPLGDGSPPPPWDPSAARGLLTYVRDAGFPLAGVELGNERNAHGYTPAEQAAAFRTLAGLLEALWPAPPRPRLWGPDADGAGALTDSPARLAHLAAYLAAFVGNLSGVPLAAVTFHEYIEVTSQTVLNGSALDASARNAAALVAAVRRVNPDVAVWGGEIGPHTGDSVGNTTNTGNCSGNKLCGRFGSCLWYADAMAASARAGVAGFARQDLVGASYALLNTSLPGEPGTAVGAFTPSPDYYLLWLWQRLVGRAVLDVAPAGGGGGGAAAAAVRVYAFCSRNDTASVTLALINIGGAPACVGAPAFVPPGGALTVFTLTPGDAAEGVEAWGARLNGRLLALRAGGALPDLSGERVPAAGGVTLPPTSVTLLVAPAGQELPACAAAETLA